MHTMKFETPGGTPVVIHHNSDWSGDAKVQWEEDGETTCAVLPAALLLHMGNRAAFERLKSKLVEFVEELEWDDEPEPARVGKGADMEAGVVLGPGNEPIHWHAPSDRSVAFLPDSRKLWDVYWEHKDSMVGFAHSHPGSGSPFPSHTDLTTFAANEQGLGKRYDWWIITGTAVGLVRWRGPKRLDYEVWVLLSEEPEWVDELRRISTD